MTQGGERKQGLSHSEGFLLWDPLRILKRVTDLDALERPDGWNGLKWKELRGKEGGNQLLESLRIQEEAVFVKWLQGGWREVDEKISAIPFGEKRWAPTEDGVETYLIRERKLKLLMGSIEEVAQVDREDGDFRSVTFDCELDKSSWVKAQFVSVKSVLARVDVQISAVPQGNIAMEFDFTSVGVVVKYYESRGFSFQIQLHEPTPAAS